MGIEQLSSIWPEWEVAGQIGEGSYGKVYKVVREEYGVVDCSAVKVISIPQIDAEVKSLRADGYDEKSARSYFESIVTDFVNEIKLMVSMKGAANIVCVEDYKVVEKTEKIGWDIFIRMELLTSFDAYYANKKLSEPEVIKLGRDVCSALASCAKRKIIHRDIKPENIFVSLSGGFKVGDFGIARELEKTSGSISSKGTYNYIAPEVVNTGRYDATVDVYSLGLVLYKLLNNNRLPFLDPYDKQITYQERKAAVDRRLDGEVLPAPVEASPQMAHAILTACSYYPAVRFSSAAAFKDALDAVEAGTYDISQPIVDLNTTTAGRGTTGYQQQQGFNDLYKTTAGRRAGVAPNMGGHHVGSFGGRRKSSRKRAVLLSGFALIGVVGIVVGIINFTINGTAESDADGNQSTLTQEALLNGEGANSNEGQDLAGQTPFSNTTIVPTSPGASNNAQNFPDSQNGTRETQHHSNNTESHITQHTVDNVNEKTHPEYAAYADLISSGISLNILGGQYHDAEFYYLFDMDGDGSDELLVAYQDSVGHWYWAIYTYSNGTFILLDESNNSYNAHTSVHIIGGKYVEVYVNPRSGGDSFKYTGYDGRTAYTYEHYSGVYDTFSLNNHSISELEFTSFFESIDKGRIAFEDAFLEIKDENLRILMENS